MLHSEAGNIDSLYVLSKLPQNAVKMGYSGVFYSVLKVPCGALMHKNSAHLRNWKHDRYKNLKKGLFTKSLLLFPYTYL